MTTPIIYYGGKSSMLHIILPLLPAHTNYSEVFFGGGAVFFAKTPAKIEVINDNLHICTNFYEQVKTNFAPLKKMIDATLLSRVQHQRANTILRNAAGYSKTETAWAFWLVTNFSFANKISSSMKFSNDNNTPVPVTMKYKKSEFTELICYRLENTVIENKDAIEVLHSCNRPETFHFIDPPYMHADQGHYKGYDEGKFKLLLDFLSNECRGKFMLTNYNSKLLSKFIKKNGWTKLEKKMISNINNRTLVNRTTEKTEVIVLNYDPDKEQQKLF